MDVSVPFGVDDHDTEEDLPLYMRMTSCRRAVEAMVAVLAGQSSTFCSYVPSPDITIPSSPPVSEV